jgi:hypothetical protein
VPPKGFGNRISNISVGIVASATTGQPGDPLDGSNVAVAQDPAGNLKPAKDKSTERIDGIVAAIMAIGRAMVAQEQPQPYYQVFWV